MRYNNPYGMAAFATLVASAAGRGLSHDPHEHRKTITKTKSKNTSKPRRIFSKLSGVIPGGPKNNVRGTYVKNPKIAQHMNKQNERWHAKRFGNQETVE